MNADEIRRKFERVLPTVTRPGRYVGGEFGAVVKEHEGRTTFVHVYPDTYEVGMSYLGGAMLRHVLNSREEFACERAFTPWPDMAAALRREGLPLLSLETKTPVRAFDAVLVSLSTELTYTNLLETLDLSRMPLRASDRKRDDPLVIAGGSCAFNLEPLAPFLDAVFVGDGEEAVVEIAGVIRDAVGSGATRDETISTLAKIEGMYVPSWYDAKYEGRAFKELVPVRPDAPETIRARTVARLDRAFYPSPPLVPALEVAHDRLSVEIMRGCPRGCRFCSAGTTYRPLRMRPVDEIVSQVVEGIAATGYDEATLLSLSSTDYDGIEILVARLADELAGTGVAVSLPSLRAETITPALLKSMSAVRARGLTLAPEAGTERLRRVIGKRIADDAVARAARFALEAGWTSVKLYFMVGLPHETQDDRAAIGRMLGRLNRLRKDTSERATLTASVAPFSPKPHTPFQWERQITRAEARAAYEDVRGDRRRRGVSYRFRDVDMAFVDGVLARAGRDVAPVVETAWRNGAVFDGWREGFAPTPWEEAFASHAIDPDALLGPFDVLAALPWSHVDKGVREFCLAGKKKADEAAAEPPEPEPPLAPVATVEERRDERYGRRPKTRQRALPTPVHAAGRGRLRVRWEKHEAARFTSHLDVGRAWERALRRAGTPVAYTEGFSPHMRLAFGPPLSVGHESRAEYIDVFLSAPAGRTHLERLRDALPPGFAFAEAKTVFSKGNALTASLNYAVYECAIPDPPPDLPTRVSGLLESAEMIVERERKGQLERVDARGRLFDVEALPSTERRALVRCEVSFDERGFLRPTEVLRFGLALPQDHVDACRVVRTALFERTAAGRLIHPLSIP